MKPEGQFTESLWESIQNIYLDLLRNPFVKHLAEGTLPHKCFAHYLSQDILYIRDDSKALENLSKRAENPSEQSFFMSLANDGIAIEQELHNHFLKAFDVKKAKLKSPVIKEYTHFLIEHSQNSSYKIAATALLPCFWVYNSVGKYILEHAAENNAYQKWIDTYRGGEYEAFTKSFIQIVENLSNSADVNEKKLMQEAFIQAAKFELKFFEESFCQP